MRARKVCMIGDFGVGKTSLVARFTRQTFSDKYLTTVGVKVDTHVVDLDDAGAVKFVLWDIAGSDRLQSIGRTYLRGLAGYVLVADGTRRETLETARTLRAQVEEAHGDKPFVLLLNKCDRTVEWDLDDAEVAGLRDQGWYCRETSALSGVGVSEAFETLARSLIGGGR